MPNITVILTYMWAQKLGNNYLGDLLYKKAVFSYFCEGQKNRKIQMGIFLQQGGYNFTENHYKTYIDVEFCVIQIINLLFPSTTIHQLHRLGNA